MKGCFFFLLSVLEDNRGVMDQQLAHLRTAVKEAEQQTDRMSKDLSGSQQQLHRTQDQQQRWKERCEVLVEQLQAEQNRAILAEKAAAEHMNKVQALKLHITQVISAALRRNARYLQLTIFVMMTDGIAVQQQAEPVRSSKYYSSTTN